MVKFWMNWCRLCARENSCDSHLNMFLVGTQEQEVINTINRVFDVDMNTFENFPTKLCMDCYYHIKTTINLTKRVSQATAMFTDLLSRNEEYIDEMEIRTLHHIDEEMIILTSKNAADLAEAEKKVLTESMIESSEVHFNSIENSNPISIEKEEQEDDFEYKPDISELLKESKNSSSSPVIENFDEKCKPKKRGKYKLKNKRMEENNTKNYYCSECHKGFLKLHNYRRHMHYEHNIEIEEKPLKYACDSCGKEHKTESALKEHRLRHIDERTLKCKHCDRKFKGIASLRHHEDTHVGTNYICSICGLRLNTLPTLRMHMLVHSDQKNHKCDFCGNEYKRAKTLKTHLILHSGLRPYACDFCDKTFTNGANCRTHQKKSHPIEFAAREAAGGQKTSTVVIPNLEELKAMTSPKVAQTSVSSSSRENTKTKSKNLDAGHQKCEKSTSKEEPDLFQNLFLPIWNYKNNNN